MGYTEIAKAMGISINTVKSYCKRNGLGGVSNHYENNSICDYCGKSIQHCGKNFIAYRNNKRKYCCHTCYIEDRYGGGEHHEDN